MRKTGKNEKNNDDIFIKLTAVQLIFCFIAFGAVFLAMKLNSDLFESFREEFSILNESDFDLGSYSFFDFGSVREKKENNRSDENSEEDDDEEKEEEKEEKKEKKEEDAAADEAAETLPADKEEKDIIGVFSALYGEATAVMPVNGKITSPYGERTHPVYGGGSFHGGEDIAAPEGTPVYAALDGTVIDVGIGPKSGNFVKISHDGEIETLYCHLKTANVKKGVAVRRGDIIGFVGQTGLATGPHLHFEVKINGEKTDPQILLEGAAVVS